jgi:hypothetical protein
MRHRVRSVVTVRDFSARQHDMLDATAEFGQNRTVAVSIAEKEAL